MLGGVEIETRHLRLVKAIADAGSITKAATTLGSSQPAVTRQLRRVERILGAELFVRSRAGVEPTSLGRLVISRADAALSVIDSLQADVSASAPPKQIRLGGRHGHAVLGLMHGIREIVPGVEIVTNSETRIGGLMDLVASSRLDLAIVHEFVGYDLRLDERIVAEPIETQPVFVAIAEDHPLADRVEVALADLSGENWLLSPVDVDREADCLSTACDAAGFAPEVVHYLNDGLGVELVRAGEAISPCAPTAHPVGTVLKPLIGSPIRLRQLLLTERHNPLAAELGRLARYVSAELAEVLATRTAYTAWVDRHES